MSEPTKPRQLPDLDHLPQTALLTRVQVSRLANFSVPTLRHWATAGRGPRVFLIEGRPRYRVADMREWLSGHGSSTTAKNVPGRAELRELAGAVR